ncbi:MAG: UDP-N-acetylmuramate--L-alanine ligase [Bacteroidales bacterium]|nr:UDP-N-acetylmuramate--L-alanine ligase [Bacteroidales bacterium]
MYSNIYFIGIGGIGMSAIARYYKFKGLNVSGYDRTETELTRKLSAEGIGVHYTDSPELIPEDIKDTLVVYTPAIPEDLQELVTVHRKGYKVVKRSRMLGEITDGQVCLAVSGTHGKTTTSTLAAHILTQSGEGCSAFLGGISKNYGTNLLMSANDVVVAEADEFDRSFLQLHPEIAVVTAMDADHLDIYGDLEHVQEAFRNFASQVSGAVIKKIGLPLGKEDTSAKLYTYSLDNPQADFYASGIRLQPDGHFVFDLNHPGGAIKDIRLGTLGWVNVENCVAASAVCLLHGTKPEHIRSAAESFQGVRRRLDVHVNRPGLTYIDDYAHHPAELATAISSLKQIFPNRTLTGVFQPHLYTRTRDLAIGFATSLSLLDELILLDIYPAREEPIEGVTSEIIFKDVTCHVKRMMHKEDLLDYLASRDLDVLATFGAGDIDRLVQPITEMLEQR